MILVVGPQGHGKKAYVLQQGYREEQIADGGTVEPNALTEYDVIDHFALLVRQLLEQNIAPKQWVETYLEKHPKGVIICEEIGSGLVPMDAFERTWREETGRLGCDLAKQATQVVRMYYGIPTVIKG